MHVHTQYVCVHVSCSHMRVLSASDVECSHETSQEVTQPPKEGYGREDLPQVSPEREGGGEGWGREGKREGNAVEGEAG